MRRIVIAVMSTLSTLLLLFSFDASTRGATSAAGRTGGAGGAAGKVSGTTDDNGTLGTAASGGATVGGGTPARSSAPQPAGGTKSFTGDVAQTQWGPVQVRIVVTSGKITASQAVQYPNGNRHDIEINDYALPLLDQSAVQAQNASFDGITGATVTSDGYKASLQSALDQAHL
jgi:uncharacterized protein with FMN-binding domain